MPLKEFGVSGPKVRSVMCNKLIHFFIFGDDNITIGNCHYFLSFFQLVEGDELSCLSVNEPEEVAIGFEQNLILICEEEQGFNRADLVIVAYLLLEEGEERVACGEQDSD